MKHIVASIVFGFLCQSAAADPAATQALNSLRDARGLAPVTYSTTLEAVAGAHARDMAKRGYFSHEGRDGSGVGARVRQQGYDWCFVAENIASGQRDLAEVMQGWTASPGHLATMTDARVTEFGLSQARGRIWVMVLARPC